MVRRGTKMVSKLALHWIEPVSRLSGNDRNSTVFNDSQSAIAPDSSTVSDLGNMIDCNEEHSLKALLPISFTALPIEIVSAALQW